MKLFALLLIFVCLEIKKELVPSRDQLLSSIPCGECLYLHYALSGKKTFYFISSNEFNAYLKQIKSVLSTVKKYHIFFFSDENDIYFSL